MSVTIEKCSFLLFPRCPRVSRFSAPPVTIRVSLSVCFPGVSVGGLATMDFVIEMLRLFVFPEALESLR
jgi:hypothetical protein